MALTHGSNLSERVIGLAIEVHCRLGPGLLESAYEECLCFELRAASIPYNRQVALPIFYKEMRLDCGYRMDLVIASELIVEIKSIERLMPIHDAQLLTYLRLSGLRVGLLMNEFQQRRPQRRAAPLGIVTNSVISVSPWCIVQNT